MTRIKKIVSLLLAILSVTVFVLVLTHYRSKKDVPLLSDFNIPNEASVLIHFSTLTDTKTNFWPSPDSELYYYDKHGTTLGKYSFDEEIVNDFIIQGENSISFFLKNQSILVSGDGTVKKFDAPPDNAIKSTTSGLSQVGLIEHSQTFYSLLNAGKTAGDSESISIVRFVSEKGSYDVAIPYFLDNITYDSAADQFICIVTSNTDLTDKDSTFEYLVIEFDDSGQCYKLNPMLNKIPHNHTKDVFNYMFRTTLAHDNIVYSAAISDTKDYIDDTDHKKTRTKGNLVLSVMDLVNQTEETIILKKDYDLDESGYGVLTGSNHMPMEIVNDKLYVFTSDKEVFVIKNDTEIDVLSLHNDFAGSLSLKHPAQGVKNDDSAFFGSEVVIGDDGEIYVLNLYPNEVLRIHQLMPDSTYKQIWQGKLPNDFNKKSYVNTFEILNS